jgi:chromosomal replication initiator protein
MIDELSFLTDFADKPLIQKEVYQILKEQSAHGCSIVLASSITLDAMTNWHKEFREWLQSGKFYIIINPSAEARKLFLKKLLTKNKFTINDDLIECFLQEVGSSFRELETAVIKVNAAANFYNAELTVKFARRTLRELATR